MTAAGAATLRGRVLRANFFHAPERGRIDHAEAALLAVAADGRIASLTRREDPGYAAGLEAAGAAGTLVELGQGQYLLPGFVDLHVHAPQYPQLGRALDAPLEVWLQKYTFPLEARYADIEFARTVYTTLVGDLLALGTTTAVYFATVHLPASRLLADICLEKGQRALVGKVAMDHPQTCPPDYRDASAARAVEETRQLIDYVRAHPGNAEGLVLPAVTPRFIPSCTDAALTGLGALVAETGCHVQTHCSESDWEHGHVLERQGRTDTRSLEAFGLLTRRTVLAHAGFITDDDMATIARRGAGVAHCPLSNAYFAGAVFPLRRALEKGVRVGLGTDISGGPSASMLDAGRMTVVAGRMLQSGVDAGLDAGKRGVAGAGVDIATAFHLATAGGAEVLDLPVGQFAPGRLFDAIAIDPAAAGGTLRLFDRPASPEDLLQSILYNASRPNIARVWVGGRQVG